MNRCSSSSWPCYKADMISNSVNGKSIIDGRQRERLGNPHSLIPGFLHHFQNPIKYFLRPLRTFYGATGTPDTLSRILIGLLSGAMKSMYHTEHSPSSAILINAKQTLWTCIASSRAQQNGGGVHTFTCKWSIARESVQLIATVVASVRVGFFCSCGHNTRDS